MDLILTCVVRAPKPNCRSVLRTRSHRGGIIRATRITASTMY